MKNTNITISENQISKPYVQSSFERCVQYEIDENMVTSKKIIDANELNRKLLDNKELIITAKPFINQLHDFVKGSDFFIILTDNEGCIFKHYGR